ncbi:MAG: DUF6448 family protein [Candidatus Bipolaricaulia bacterium]
MPPHCDTMDGPVVNAAQEALEKNNVNLVLPWLPEEGEEEVKEAFEKTIEVRDEGEKVRELADYWFYETCVRIHRMGEGAAYTGIKPAGLEEGKAVEAADKSLEDGSVEDVVDFLTESVEAEVKQSYREVLEKREEYEEALERDEEGYESVQAGREYVDAYVHYIHHVKGIHDACLGNIEHQE